MSPKKFKKIGIIGVGNMGGALLCAIRDVLKQRVYVYDKNRKRIASSGGIKVSSSKDLISRCDVVILAIKPQDIKDFLKENKEYFDTRRHLLISIAAGVPTRFFESHVRRLHVIRVMPNLPAKVKQAVSFLSKGKYATRNDLKLACNLFSATGMVYVVGESLLNKVTAISGSGPGYVYYFMNALYEAAVSLGIRKKIVYQMVIQTVRGAAELAGVSNKDFSRLMKEVASRGGTTEAAFKIFNGSGLPDIVKKGVTAAAQRAEALILK